MDGSVASLLVAMAVAAMTAFLTFVTMRRSGVLPVQQAAVDNLQATVGALVTRVGLLEQERAELEKKHEGELTALRGQFMKALAEKDLAILDLRRDMQAQSEEKAGLQARITTLEEDLRQAQADLARYASEALRRQDARTRSGDPASRSQRPVRQPAVLHPVVDDGGADDDAL